MEKKTFEQKKNRMEDEVFVAQVREALAEELENIVTDPEESMKTEPSDYLLTVPDRLRAGEKISPSAFLNEVFYRVADKQLHLTVAEKKTMHEMFEKGLLDYPYPDLPRMKDGASRINDPEVLDTVLKYLSDRLDDRVATEPGKYSARELKKFEGLYDKVKSGQDISGYQKNRGMHDAIIRLCQDLRLSVDEIDDLREVLWGEE